MEELVRVLIADDHPLIHEGVRSALRRDETLQLIGAANDGLECQQLAQLLTPDVLLLDLNMPGPPPLETLSELNVNCPGVKVVVLSAYDDYVSVRALLRAGVKGYVLKNEAIDILLQAIRTVALGGTWFSQIVVQKLARTARITPEFTGREQDVLHCLARGASNDMIASELDVTERTIRFHLKNIYRKLEVETRGEAIVWAVRAGYGGQRQLPQ
jgi:DNA-binding NarL/FixJ family response regulator